MKNILQLFVTGIFLLFICCNQQASRGINSNSAVNKRLLALLEQREYFRLETQLNFFKDNIDSKQRLYFQSFVDNAFNRNKESLKDIDTLFENYPSGISDSAVF